MRGIHMLGLPNGGPDDERVPDLGHDLEASRLRDLYDPLESDEAPLGIVTLTFEELPRAVNCVPDSPLLE